MVLGSEKNWSPFHHTGYPDATNAVGENHRGYKQWRHGNNHGKKKSNSSIILSYLECYFATFLSFNRCMGKVIGSGKLYI